MDLSVGLSGADLIDPLSSLDVIDRRVGAEEDRGSLGPLDKELELWDVGNIQIYKL